MEPTPATPESPSVPSWAGGSPDRVEPTFETVEELRAHRRRHVAISYRLFGALGWGSLGDGHITARDPEQTDAFWLLRYGVPFTEATIDDLVLVGPGARLLDGEGPINMTAYFIHAPVHEARPEVVCAAHTHTPYGTPWAAQAREFTMICQEATAFFEDHSVFDGEEVQVMDPETGKRIAAALGDRKATILRNHGPLTVGRSVEEAIGWFLMMERVAEVHLKARDARPISDEAARIAATEIAAPDSALAAYEYAVMSRIPGVVVE